MATHHEVLTLHTQHPDWNARQIADALHCRTGYVTATAKRQRVSLPPTRRETLTALGRAARDCGLTIKDIYRIAVERAKEPHS
jgi:hypothetical protein